MCQIKLCKTRLSNNPFCITNVSWLTAFHVLMQKQNKLIDKPGFQQTYTCLNILGSFRFGIRYKIFYFLLLVFFADQ